MTLNTLAILGLPGGTEWIVILGAALLIFGRRLPDVARSLGRSIVEFKKGVKGIESDVEEQSSLPPSPPPASTPTNTTSGSSSENSHVHSG